MSKGANTKARIIRQAAELMNVRGYVSTPISEILGAVELKKGGLYNHFKSRDAVAAAAYEYAVDLALMRMLKIEQAEGPAIERLFRLLDSYRNYSENIDLKGGCPLLRGAVESANGPDWLHQRARGAIQRMIGIFERLLAEAKGAGDIRADLSPNDAATAIVAALEGAVMLCGIQKSGQPSVATLDLVDAYVQTCLVTKKDR